MIEDAFVDGATRAVLGTDALVRWLEPDSPAGARRAGALSVFGADERGAWERTIERTRQAESWADDHPEALRELRDGLSNVPDIERPMRRLQIDETLDESDLFAVKRFLYWGHRCLESADELLERDPETADWSARASELMDQIHPQKKITARFHLASALDDDLAAIRKEYRQLERRERTLRDELEGAIVDEHGGRFDIRGRFRVNADSNVTALEDDARLTRTTDGWQLRDPALTTLRSELADAERAVEEVERRVRAALTEALGDEREWFQSVSITLAELDVQLAKSRLRARLSGTWPHWSETTESRISGGRDFAVMRTLPDGESVQPVDVELDDAPVVVSGPNMGGKSALLRLIGLCQWAAQHALPVPADAYSFAPVDAIVYVGSEEPQAEAATEGLSSFGREVRRLVDWWDRGGSPRLWLLDEVGRGTHPDEGARIAVELIEQLADRGDRCVAATHFPAVAAMKRARKLRIAGLTDPALLEEELGRSTSDDAAELQRALRASMDYRPLPVDEHDVPRDARVVARALGLPLDDD